jgi:DNA-binding NarL/FixJ family response regulator
MTGRILVVDDHEDFRQALISFLSAIGLDVVGEAANGADAVAAVRELEPDLVLMDVSMPEGDGIAATERLKQEWPALPVVMLCGAIEPCDRAAAMAVGADAVITKVLKPAEIQFRIAPLLAGGC